MALSKTRALQSMFRSFHNYKPILRFSSLTHQQQPTFPPLSNLVNEISRVLSDHRSPHHDLDHSLTAFSSHISSQLVEQVLKRCKNLGFSAHRFFLWAAKIPGFQHSDTSYRILVDVLGSNQQFAILWDFLVEIRDSKQFESNPEIFWLVFKAYCRANLAWFGQSQPSKFVKQPAGFLIELNIGESLVRQRKVFRRKCSTRQNDIHAAFKVRSIEMRRYNLKSVFIRKLCKNDKIDERAYAASKLRIINPRYMAGYNVILAYHCEGILRIDFKKWQKNRLLPEINHHLQYVTKVVHRYRRLTKATELWEQSSADRGFLLACGPNLMPYACMVNVRLEEACKYFADGISPYFFNASSFIER
ncbi:hypothetical protein GOBAR_DD05882 [Gossypium barbadense]|nr:hypothetical protein GOBAR_DD05882 [Gossypium barbadense]